jgi:hypothetical protein
MRNAMPVRWIEQKEARQVITAALFERAPKAPWSAAAENAAAQWLPRLGAWLATRHPMGWPVPQAQPALIRRPPGQPARRPRADDDYSGDW